MLAYDIYLNAGERTRICSLINSYLRGLGYQQLSYLFLIRSSILHGISKESSGGSWLLVLHPAQAGIGSASMLFLLSYTYFYWWDHPICLGVNVLIWGNDALAAILRTPRLKAWNPNIIKIVLYQRPNNNSPKLPTSKSSQIIISCSPVLFPSPSSPSLSPSVSQATTISP